MPEWVLGINSSSEALGVAIAKDGALRAEIVVVPEGYRGGHSENLLPAIDSLCELAGIGPVDLTAVAVAVGPGGFTGVRTGVTAAKVIAMARRIKVVPVLTLEALAAQAPHLGLISPLLDARRGDVFAALYRRTPRELIEVLPGRLASLEEWLTMLSEYRGESIALLGEGVTAHSGAIASRAPGYRLNPELNILRAATVALLGSERLDRAEDPEALLPQYLRAPTAIAKFEGTCS